MVECNISSILYSSRLQLTGSLLYLSLLHYILLFHFIIWQFMLLLDFCVFFFRQKQRTRLRDCFLGHTNALVTLNKPYEMVILFCFISLSDDFAEKQTKDRHPSAEGQNDMV